MELDLGIISLGFETHGDLNSSLSIMFTTQTHNLATIAKANTSYSNWDE